MENSRTLTKEHRYKISQSCKGRSVEGAISATSIPVTQHITLDDKVMWPSVREAARSLGIDASNISKVCNGLRNSAGGFFWSFT